MKNVKTWHILYLTFNNEMNRKTQWSHDWWYYHMSDWKLSYMAAILVSWLDLRYLKKINAYISCLR